MGGLQDLNIEEQAEMLVETTSRWCTVQVCAMQEIPISEGQYTEELWNGIPRIMSGKDRTGLSCRSLFVNAYSMSPQKRSTIRSKPKALDIKVLIICEVWPPAASNYMAIEGYRRRASTHQGGGIAIWVRDDWGSELRKPLDIDHCLMIIVAARGRNLLIFGGHMPHRNQAAHMYKVLNQVKQCMERVNVRFIIFMADWNRHLLQDAKLSKWLQDHHLHVEAQGTEPRLHKDWCVVHRF